MGAMGFHGGSAGKESTCNAGGRETEVRSPGQEDPLEEGKATHSSILAGRIPWTGSLAGYSSWGGKEAFATGALSADHLNRPSSRS